MSTSDNQPTIIIDTREQNPLSFPEGTPVSRSPLAAGDYSVLGFTSAIAVERKSHADAWGSVLRSRRRFEAEWRLLADLQVGAGARQYRGFAAILIEVSWERLALPPTNRHDPRKAESVLGTYRAWSEKYGVPVVCCDGREAAAEWLIDALTRESRRVGQLVGGDA